MLLLAWTPMDRHLSPDRRLGTPDLLNTSQLTQHTVWVFRLTIANWRQTAASAAAVEEAGLSPRQKLHFSEPLAASHRAWEEKRNNMFVRWTTRRRPSWCDWSPEHVGGDDQLLEVHVFSQLIQEVHVLQLFSKLVTERDGWGHMTDGVCEAAEFGGGWIFFFLS